jgi:hypothetical protein
MIQPKINKCIAYTEYKMKLGAFNQKKKFNFNNFKREISSKSRLSSKIPFGVVFLKADIKLRNLANFRQGKGLEGSE